MNNNDDPNSLYTKNTELTSLNKNYHSFIKNYNTLHTSKLLALTLILNLLGFLILSYLTFY